MFPVTTLYNVNKHEPFFLQYGVQYSSYKVRMPLCRIFGEGDATLAGGF